MGDRNHLQLTMLGTVSLAVVISLLQLQTVLSLPVSIDANGRALRSVTLHRPNPWDGQPVSNLLLSQQQTQQPTQPESPVESIFARRENKSTHDIATISSTSSGDGSYVGEELVSGSGDGANANGTLSNDTQVGSRLKQNETEPCSLEPNILCSSDPPHSNRDKQRRIAHIANYVWTNLFGNRTRPINKEMVRERFAPVNPSSSSSSFSGDLESIAVSCDLPPEVESEAWSTERNFNLFFNLSSKYPDVFAENSLLSEQDGQQAQEEQLQSSESGQPNEFLPITGSQSPFPTIPVAAAAGKSGKAVNVISAKLRLYKIGSTVPAFTAMVPSEPCNDTESALGLDEEVPTVVTTTATFPERTDDKIRVSIFWYTQPATKNHYKKKLLDAKMLSLGESEWVEFDIKKAASAWLNDRKPNYGVVVEVENENQDALDPKKYFGGVPCYKTSSSRDPAYQNDEIRNEQQDGGATSGGVITTSTSPMIEICTLNVPETTQAKVFPYSININSLKHLQQVADSHAKSSDRNGSSQTRLPWQNINLRVISPEDFGITDSFGSERRSGSGSSSRTRRPTSTIVVPSHKHRHHHELNSQNGNNNNGDSNSESVNQRGRTGVSHPPQVILDEDHPLRGILATVNGNSKEHNKRGGSANTGSRRFPESFGQGFPSRNADMAADEGRIESDYLDSTEHERDVFITKIVITPEQLKQNVLNGRSIFPFPTSMSSLPPMGSTSSSTGSLSDR